MDGFEILGGLLGCAVPAGGARTVRHSEYDGEVSKITSGRRRALSCFLAGDMEITSLQWRHVRKP